MATTLHAIFATWVTNIKALTPANLSDVKFDRAPPSKRLRAWASQSTPCLRKFEIRRTGEAEDPDAIPATAIKRLEEATITIAYPVLPGKYRLGAVPDDLRNMDEIIRKDAQQIRDVVFSAVNYVTGQYIADPRIKAVDESDDDVWFQDIVVDVRYLEAMTL